MTAPKPKPRSNPKPAPIRPSASQRPATKKVKVFDLLLFAIGVALLAALGYVGYHTQVLGEPVEKVLPFLSDRHAADEPAPKPEAGKPVDDPLNKKNPAGDKPAAGPREPNPDDTVFGRRIR